MLALEDPHLSCPEDSRAGCSTAGGTSPEQSGRITSPDHLWCHSVRCSTDLYSSQEWAAIPHHEAERLLFSLPPECSGRKWAALCHQCNPSNLKESLTPASPRGAKCSAQAQTQLKNANKNKSSTAQAGAPVLTEVPLPLGWVHAVKQPSAWFPPSSWLPHHSHYKNMSSLLGANELASSKQNLGVVLGEFTPGISSKWQSG